ncbi:hypothetical protein NUW54_g6857 [Trametes sanguinea]|uniref:Uncharacterized protein n=1 Tax=Trametes sanguinea TaxID=158606 RepID=A0ACC1PT51_9APHY|nr:hypothetical protein NUW54_g6857 [Trametes sanguinea]
MAGLRRSSRGTRVCIFCSKTFTRALISDTICTPLLLDAVGGATVDVLAVLAVNDDVARLAAGRGTGVRGGGKRDGLADRPGCVADLARYRAVIAFKIFRAEGPACETEETRILRQKVVDAVKEMEPTYGILLGHQYCLGAEQFSGFDAIFLDALRTLDGLIVHHLPVAVSLYAYWGSESRYSYEEDWEMSCLTSVYPFASSYIDLLNKEGHVLPSEHEHCGYPWLKNKPAIPFYCLDLSQSLYEAFGEGETEACNYVGNEAQACREDSVYLSYALVVLKADDEGVSTKHTGRENLQASNVE